MNWVDGDLRLNYDYHMVVLPHYRGRGIASGLVKVCAELHTDVKLSCVSSMLSFVKKNVNSAITEEDVEQYEEVLDDLTLNVDNSSILLDKQNRPSLVALVAYSFENDIDLDDWIIKFFENNTTYIRNQKENFFHMIQDLTRFVENEEEGK